MLAGSVLKLTLKRGALVAAANWPVTIVQAVADALFKMLVAVPLVGGIFLVALVVGAEPVALLSLGWRELAATIVTSLLSRPVVLASFLASLAVAVVGGSLFVFFVKGGTVGVLVRGEREAGAIEQPPLHLQTIARAARFSVDGFLASANGLFPRFARLGLALMAVYLVSGLLYLASVFGSRTAGAIGMTALLTVAFVMWITVVNLLYLLVQLAIAADDCSVSSAVSRVAAFLRRERRQVTAVFLVVLAMVVAATAASVLATAALGLIAFVPFLWLVVVPLQLAAWLLRALVFQYIGMASIGAYLKLYRTSGPVAAGAPAGTPASYAAIPGERL